MKNRNFIQKKTEGFTLIETMLSIVIIAILSFLISMFVKNIFGYNAGIQAGLNAELEGRKVLKTIVSELRSTAPSALGGYALETLATSSLTFYTDTNSDGSTERVRYFLDPVTKTLKKGVVVPTGSPLSYNLAGETISTLVTDVSNPTSTPIFDYFDSSYAGTSSPLTLPVNVFSVRLIKVTVIVDRDLNRTPTPITFTSQVSPRNLKDNL